MPGEPNECREHAERCWVLASTTKNPVLKALGRSRAKLGETCNRFRSHERPPCDVGSQTWGQPCEAEEGWLIKEKGRREAGPFLHLLA
jgi:hypothetical protein